MLTQKLLKGEWRCLEGLAHASSTTLTMGRKARKQNILPLKKVKLIAPRPSFFVVSPIEIVRMHAVNVHLINRFRMILKESLLELSTKLPNASALRRTVSTPMAAVQTFIISGRKISAIADEYFRFAAFCESLGGSRRILTKRSPSSGFARDCIEFVLFDGMVSALAMNLETTARLFNRIETYNRTGEKYVLLASPSFRDNDNSISILLLGVLRNLQDNGQLQTNCCAKITSGAWLEDDFENDYEIRNEASVVLSNSTNLYRIEWIPNSANSCFGSIQIQLPLTRLRGKSALELARKIGL